MRFPVTRTLGLHCQQAHTRLFAYSHLRSGVVHVACVPYLLTCAFEYNLTCVSGFGMFAVARGMRKLKSHWRIRSF